MNILQNLVELYNHLPLDSTYRVVVKGILEHLRQMREVTVYDIAELTNSSRTTVQRMVQKMGYKTFADFRFSLERAARQLGFYNRILPKEVCNGSQQILEAVSAQLQESAELFERVVSPEQLEARAARLHEAPQVSIYLPTRIYAVHVLQQNLAMDGKATSYHCLLPEMIEDAEQLPEGSVAIIGTIEFTETLDMTRVFETASARGAEIWLASGTDSNYRRYAACNLMPEDAGVISWNIALEAVLISLSECYRRRYVDR